MIKRFVKETLQQGSVLLQWPMHSCLYRCFFTPAHLNRDMWKSSLYKLTPNRVTSLSCVLRWSSTRLWPTTPCPTGLGSLMELCSPSLTPLTTRYNPVFQCLRLFPEWWQMSRKLTPLHLLQVGAAISMTYITGQPIVFVGTGQTYSDLRSLNARAVVSALMKA